MEKEAIEENNLEYNLVKVLSKEKDLTKSSTKLLEIMCNSLEWDLGILWFYDRGIKRLVFQSYWRRPDKNFDRFLEHNKMLEFAKGDGIAGITWKRQKPLWVQNVKTEKRFLRKKLARQAKLVSVAAYPLNSGREFIGVMEFFSQEEKVFNRKQRRYIGVISSQVALILKRILVEAEVEEARRQLEAIFKSVPEGITVENRRGEIVFANDSIAKIFGFNKADDVKGKTMEKVLTNFIISDAKGKIYTFSDLPAAKIFAGKRKAQAKLAFLNLTTGNEKWLQIKATPVAGKDKTPNLVVKSFQDITKMVEAQRERELFLAIVGHELKSPLASIKAFSQLMARRVKDEGLTEYIKNLDRQANRLISIVGNILDSTKIRAGLFDLNKKRFKFDRLIDEVVGNFRLTAPNKIILYGKTSIHFYGDEDRIAQTLTNLLTNASRYSEPNQKIIVMREFVDGKIRVSVRDFGVGISKENIKKIFKLYKRFQSDKGKGREGLGMGLFIASAIIKAHGGDIEVESELGRGSTFTFVLPFSIKKNTLFR